jgi:hypothetical protein
VVGVADSIVTEVAVVLSCSSSVVAVPSLGLTPCRQLLLHVSSGNGGALLSLSISTPIAST